MSEDRRQTKSVRRVAIITSATTTAECPLEAVCVSTLADLRRKVRCGYYQGSITSAVGTVVRCSYIEE